jgi:hypothetical protein
MDKDIYGDNNRIIARIRGKELRKLVKASKHLQRNLNAYGMDSHILNEEFEEIKILDQENDIMYSVPKHIFVEHGIKKNFGYGDQTFLPLHYFEVHHRKQAKLEI